MTVQQLFKKAEVASGAEITEFWEGIAKCLTGGMPYQGFSFDEIKAYINVNESKYGSCGCGNSSFNCICYSDAE